MTEIIDFLVAGNFAMKPRLLQQLKSVCTDKTVNTTDSGDVVGPAVYLLKVLVRQHGFHSLNGIFKQSHSQWIIPSDLQEAEQVCIV